MNGGLGWTQIATVNRAFCKAVRELTDQDAFRPRVFVADSKAVLAHELDVEQGDAIAEETAG